MGRKIISILIMLILVLTAFSSLVFAHDDGGGGCPTTADYYVTGTVNSGSTFKIYKGDIPGLPSGYNIDDDSPYCESCGDADVKGSGTNRYVEFDPDEDSRCCGAATFFFKVKGEETYEDCDWERVCDKRWVCTRWWPNGSCRDGHWEYYNCRDEWVCHQETRTIYKTVKVTLDVVQSYDYEVTATIDSGQIFKLYENDPQLPEGTNIKDKFYCSSGICGELDYKGVDGPDYIQYIPYVEECSDCHWECPGSYRCGCNCGCEWVCEGCENRDCCGPNTFYFKIEVPEEYQYWDDCCNKVAKGELYWDSPTEQKTCSKDRGCCSGCYKTGTRTVEKIVKATVTVNCEPPCETAPIANDDSYRTNENTCAIFNVIENDIDPDDPTNPDLTIVDVTVPEYGTAEISGNKIYYCPTTNYCGEDTFYYQIATENGCDKSNYAKVTVTIPCKTPLSESLLYPNLGIERLNIPATGANIISDGQIISALEVVPGTQSLLVDVENRGMVTQAEVKVTFEGLPEGVSFSMEPSAQKITAHNIGTFSLTLTASPDVPEGTYQVTIKAFSQRGSLDQKVITVVIT